MNCRWRMAASLWLMTALLPSQAEEASGCVDVSVGGYRAPDYGCLSRQMGSSADASRAEQHNQTAMKQAFGNRSPSQKGLATPAATSTRMGNTFGTGVKPQRPATPPSGSPLIRAP